MIWNYLILYENLPLKEELFLFFNLMLEEWWKENKHQLILQTSTLISNKNFALISTLGR